MLILPSYPVDCLSMTCSEPLTNTPPGSPCGCVWPLQVKLRIGIAISKFFPLVSELAEEIAASLSLNHSQVCIVGADAANQQLEKTNVLIKLVPKGVKFDDSTAFSMYKKFWHKEVLKHASLFGAYEVLYVHYPGYTLITSFLGLFHYKVNSYSIFGNISKYLHLDLYFWITHAGLPPSPPSTSNGIDDGPYPGRDNNGTIMKPLGVDVSRKTKGGSNGRMIIVIVLSSVTAFVLFIGLAWLCLLKYSSCVIEQEQVPDVLISSSSKQSG